MSHEVFGERFFGHRRGGWHELGLVSDEDLTAEEVGSRISLHDVELVPLQTISGSAVPYRAIQRTETPDDPVRRTFGVVGPEYELLAPLEICRLWDEHVKLPIETMGVLRSGKELFISCNLGEYDIAGDEIKNYLTLVSPYDGWSSIMEMVTGVRTVCANTLSLAKSRATSTAHIAHVNSVAVQVGGWLDHFLDRAQERMQEQQAFLNRLVSVPLSENLTLQTLFAIYPIPVEPNYAAMPPVVAERREADWNSVERAATRSRGAVLELLNGAGTGSDTEAYRNTAWGLYNAVVEWEDWRATTDVRAAAYGRVLGDRASIKARAAEILGRM